MSFPNYQRKTKRRITKPRTQKQIDQSKRMWMIVRIKAGIQALDTIRSDNGFFGVAEHELNQASQYMKAVETQLDIWKK